MSISVEKLTIQDRPALAALLAQDPIHNLYLIGLLEDFGIGPGPASAPFAFWGAFRGRRLCAALFVGAGGEVVVPSKNPEEELGAIGGHLANAVSLRAILGAKRGVEVLCHQLGGSRPQISKCQRIFSVSADDLGPFTNPTLRLAIPSDLPQLTKLCAGWVQEAFGRDPLIENRAMFEAKIAQRISSQRTYVLEVDRRLVFKVDVGARSPSGAQLEGLYTAKEHRREGHATLSLGQISRKLLSSLPRLTLRIDEQAGSLIRIARKVGYVARDEQVLSVFS